jgi:hypothetical protein
VFRCGQFDWSVVVSFANSTRPKDRPTVEFMVRLVRLVSFTLQETASVQRLGIRTRRQILQKEPLTRVVVWYVPCLYLEKPDQLDQPDRSQEIWSGLLPGLVGWR